MPFLPNDYKPPTTEGKYLKFKEKETRFRFLGEPIIGWVGWKEKKSLRKVSRDEFSPADVDKGDLTKIRHFWAAPVWGYGQKRVQIIEIVQSTIQAKIDKLSRDEDWGDPRDYDLLVTSTLPGQLETEYDVIAKPKRELSEDARSAWFELQANGFDLSRLWTGGDPFGDGTTSEAEEYNERNPPPF